MSTGSQYAPYADLSLGILDSYNESSFNRINDIAYNTYEGFVQDSWKVSKRLTLELGIRMSHFQPWADRLGYGFSIFDYSQYKSSCSPTDYCGFVWHTRNASVPLGGFPTRALFYQPRFGLVYDVFGTGKTVIRGGWGRFDFHAGQFRTDWMWPPESKPSILRAQVPAVFHYWLANSTQVTRRSARYLRRRSIPRMTSNRTPTATVSPLPSGRHGPDCSIFLTWATRRSDIPNASNGGSIGGE